MHLANAFELLSKQTLRSDLLVQALSRSPGPTGFFGVGWLLGCGSRLGMGGSYGERRELSQGWSVGPEEKGRFGRWSIRVARPKGQHREAKASV